MELREELQEDLREWRKKFLLLQVNDALFPIGAYSHSYGLETYIQKNLLSSFDEVWEFLSHRMRYSFCCNELLSVRLAYEYAAAGQMQKIEALEELLEASRVPRETREAGHKLGSRFVKTVMEMDIPYESDIFRVYCGQRRERATAHSIAYGVFCAAVGIPYEDVMSNYLYAQVSSMVTNCVKAIPLSQTDGQRLLFKCQELFPGLLEEVKSLTEEELCLSAPGMDIRCMHHEALYSSLDMS